VVERQQDQLADTFAPQSVSALLHDPQAQPDDMVDAGAIAGDGSLDDGVQPVIGDSQRRAGLIVNVGTDWVLPRQGPNVIIWTAGTAAVGVGGNDV
jgi:hypothetical protein